MDFTAEAEAGAEAGAAVGAGAEVAAAGAGKYNHSWFSEHESHANGLGRWARCVACANRFINQYENII